ncbi:MULTISPECIES: outer membrane beta-barrel protein [unclassified Pseudoalteromonas]|uniref:outer membrane beta-barrel protein n=1 Tax=unclassified Pseudoalteromonas TaxID=194690 RepID=UPI0005A8CB77|nr:MULTISPECIES: outer membrane beta-barrel protein [unclassified Pseudoalteromonas]
MKNIQKNKIINTKMWANTPVYTTVLMCIVSSVAQANQDTNWYLNAGLGNVSGSRSVAQYSKDLSKNDITVTHIDIDNNRMGFKLNLGYEVNDSFAIELGYLDLNDVKLELTAVVSDPDLFIKDAATVHPHSANGFTIDTVYRYDFNDSYDLSASVGLFKWYSHFNTYDMIKGKALSSDNRNGLDLSYGLSGGYKITSSFSLLLTWQQFKLGNDTSQMWSVGTRYQF